MDLQEARQAVGKVQRSGVVDNDYYPLAGGLNIVETPMQLAPGELLGVLNYEPKTLGGYQRLQGYERFDGHPAPSQAQYYIVNFTAGSPAFYPVVGATVTGVTSGATGVALVATVPGLNNTGYAVIGQLSATPFTVNEQLKVGATPFGMMAGLPQGGAAPTDALDSAYQLAAQQVARALIAAVPGAGPVRGVVMYKGTCYAFRNNANQTAVVMYKSTPAGWVAIPGYPILNFSAGLNQINEGDTVHGVVSGNNAVVRRVVLTSGDWAGGTAAGYLVLASGSPAFQNAESLTDTTQGGIASATTVGTAVAPALLPSGSYEFRVTNFYGAYKSTRIYGCDGVNQAFEFQDAPDFYNPISTGMATDAPLHLAAHRGRLWLAFAGGSLQPSAVNDPTVWSALLGAAELGVGNEITGILEEMSPSQSAFYSTATMFVFSPMTINTITGDGPNWILGPFATEIGANPFTMQRLGQGVFLSDRGFCALNAVQQLGSFALATFSQKIQSLVGTIVNLSAFATVSRNRSLYRLFLSDGTMVSIGFKDLKVTGITFCDLSQAMFCGWNGESNDTAQGVEQAMLGGANGFVYQMDSGVNLDGAQLNAFMQTAFHFSKSPSRQKRYRFARFDMLTQGATSISIAPFYSFGNQMGDAARTLQLAGSGGAWDVSLWNNFVYDSAFGQIPTVKCEASGSNIGFQFSHSSINDAPHTIQGITLTKSVRRLERSSIA